MCLDDQSGRLLRRRVLMPMLAPFLPPELCFAQRPATFAVTVKVVNLLATVRDAQGRYIASLQKDDFVLREDGRAQTIGYFSAQGHLPLTLGLLIDTSLSQREVMADERKASARFLDRILRKDTDKAFVVGFGRNVSLLQSLTSSQKLLRSAVNGVRGSGVRIQSAWGQEDGDTSECGCPLNVEVTKLHDAVCLSSKYSLWLQKVRKALIVLSDGIDRGSDVSLPDAIAAAQRADSTVYSIQYFDARTYQRNLAAFGHIGKREQSGLVRRPSIDELLDTGRTTLKRMAEETGGAFFQVSGKETSEQVFAMIQEELRNSYSIGYSSDRPDTDGRYRKIALETRQKGLTVRTRDGYYPAF